MATHSETVRAIHEDYLRAGAEILIANSFGTSRRLYASGSIGELRGLICLVLVKLS
jgi:methionine synthase I (cobalamin-dependent)